MEEVICDDCGEPISDEVYKFRDDNEIFCKDCFKKRFEIIDVCEYLEDLKYNRMCDIADDKYDDV